MGLSKRFRVGVAVLAAGGMATAGVPSAGASVARATALVPLSGDWEGSGAHGLPLSFSLARRGGHLVATSLSLGAPSVCPANARDTKVLALTDVAYAGPGGARGAGGSAGASALSGLIAGQAVRASLTGTFTSRRAGTFSLQVRSEVGCGWPQHTLTWAVHPAIRRPVPDGTWSAQLSGPGISAGAVTIVVRGAGRVIESLRGSLRCQTSTEVGAISVDATPAYEFIRPDGSFYSPLAGNAIKGHSTLWSGRFTSGHRLTGTLSIYDSCTRQLVRAGFRGGLVRPGHGA